MTDRKIPAAESFDEIQRHMQRIRREEKRDQSTFDPFAERLKQDTERRFSPFGATDFIGCNGHAS